MASSSYVCGERFPLLTENRRFQRSHKYCQSWALKGGILAAPSQAHQEWLVSHENNISALGVVLALPANPDTMSSKLMGQKEVGTKCLECFMFFYILKFLFCRTSLVLRPQQWTSNPWTTENTARGWLPTSGEMLSWGEEASAGCLSPELPGKTQ